MADVLVPTQSHSVESPATKMVIDLGAARSPMPRNCGALPSITKSKMLDGAL